MSIQWTFLSCCLLNTHSYQDACHGFPLEQLARNSLCRSCPGKWPTFSPRRYLSASPSRSQPFRVSSAETSLHMRTVPSLFSTLSCTLSMHVSVGALLSWFAACTSLPVGEGSHRCNQAKPSPLSATGSRADRWCMSRDNTLRAMRM